MHVSAIQERRSTLTDILREDRFADQVKELDLYTSKILSNFMAFHLAQADSQRSQQFASSALPKLVESVFQYAATTDSQQEIEIAQMLRLRCTIAPLKTGGVAAGNIAIE